MTVEEVGLSPGSYRIIDLYCFKEVLNQIMKVSFGTSTIVDVFSSGTLAKPDIDIRIDNCLQDLDDQTSFLQKLRRDLYSGKSDGGKIDTAVIHVMGEERGDDFRHLDTSGSHLDTSGSAALTCSICSKEFKKSFNLKQHIRTHTNEKPLRCNHCEKRFNDKSSMNKHIRSVHSDFRPHKCHVCGKGFVTTSHLNDHSVTHTNQKKYQCLHCDKLFAFRSSLNKHSNTHMHLINDWPQTTIEEALTEGPA